MEPEGRAAHASGVAFNDTYGLHTMKRDLLHECNDQRIPAKDFTQTFCARCRNHDCVNAGWAGSVFEKRVSTQVERMLTNPIMARPEDSRFDPVRAMHFVEVAEAIVLRRREDPWAGPGVFLAEPDPSIVTLPTVEDAVTKLAEARGKKPPAVSISTEPEPEIPIEALPQPPPPPAVTPVLPPVVVSRPAANTDFPEDGVMIGGAPPPTRQEPVSADPWAPKPKHNIVPAGAKIRMGS